MYDVAPSYQRWTVRGFLRSRVEWDAYGVPFNPTPSHREPVVVVLDPRGWEWHVTVEDNRITSLTIKGADITPAAMRSVPLSYLREVATTYLSHVEWAVEEGLNLADALAEADRDPGAVRVRGDRPAPAEFAETWNNTQPFDMAGGTNKTRKQMVADHYKVSEHAVNKWLRRARDTVNPETGLPYLPPATTGRKRAAPKSNNNPTTKKKDNQE